MWVVVKIMVPFGIPIIIRHLKKRINLDNHPCIYIYTYDSPKVQEKECPRSRTSKAEFRGLWLESAVILLGFRVRV